MSCAVTVPVWRLAGLHLAGLHGEREARSARAPPPAAAHLVRARAQNNATCFLGPHRRYDPFTKSFMTLVPGQGHFGPDAIPGDARWRRGESVSLKTARDSMVGLELAQHAQMVYQPK